MKVATKLALAFALHVALLGTVLIYHVHSLREAVSSGYRMTEISSRIYTTDQLGRVEPLEQSAAKYWVTRDPGYLDKFRELFAAHRAQLDQLDAPSLTARERRELSALHAEWDRLAPLAARLGELGSDSSRDAFDSLVLLQRRLRSLGAGTQAMSEASQQALRTRLQESALAARQAERLSWIAAALALILSVVVSIVLVRSISESLRRLKHGAREVAEGRFDYRLETRRNDEFAELARGFNSMTERLAELEQMKRDFVSKISHDLKTPLVSMRETVGVILDEVPGPLTKKQRHLLLLNLESTERLSSMLAKLLDLSRFEAGRVQPELRSVEVFRLVRRAVEQSDAACGERGLRIATNLPDRPLLLDCDEDRLLQLLQNLLENAIKFSPVGSEIRFDVQEYMFRPRDIPPARWRPPGDGARNLVLSVADQGPGVPDDQKDRVFERFYQVDGGRRPARGGVGLGLTICREIAAAHGGTIWIADNPGGGCTVRVLVPGAHFITVESEVEGTRELSPALGES